MALKKKDVEITLLIKPEDLPVKGNVCAIDPETDRKAEAQVYSELSKGNEWAWCVVTVEARHPNWPDLVGRDSLGTCSYDSEKDFKRGPYWKDMQDVAIRDLQDQIDQRTRFSLEAGRIIARDGKDYFHVAPLGEPGADYKPVEMDELVKRIVYLLNEHGEK